MMAYWWETYDDVPSNNTATPPDGAPEGHFPSAVNDIARQAMAATAELGGLILAPDATGSPPRPTATGLVAGFAQLVYDLSNPVGRVVMWNSKHDGVADAKVYPVPSNVTAVWQRCDGTNNTPDTRKKVIGGADPVDASPVFSGDVLGDADTALGGAVDTSLEVTDDHTLIEAELAAHSHGITDAGHTHGYSGTFGSKVVGANQPNPTVADPPAAQTSDPSTTGIIIDPTVGNDGHSHGLSALTIPDHVHGSDPLRTSLEYWQRTA